MARTNKYLTPPELQRLEELEEILRVGIPHFLRVGRALLEIRDCKLYR